MERNEAVFKQQRASEGQRYRSLSLIATQSAILFVFWLLLSGHYDVKHIVMGAILACLVAILTNDLFYSVFYPEGSPKGREKGSLLFIFLCWLRLLAYVPWLLYNIIVANLRVAYLVLHPRMPINPSLLLFGAGLQRDISRVTLANSITLTPGTVTVSMEDGAYLVHVLEPKVAEKPLLGKIQNKVGAVFGERREPPPSFLWSHSIPPPIWGMIAGCRIPDNVD